MSSSENCAATGKIPVLVCIDVEPDEREIDPYLPARWEGFERTFDFFQELRPRLEVVTQAPVRFTWLLRMDPQIAHTYHSPEWVARNYQGLLETLTQAGDEIGLHTHAWRWDSSTDGWIADMADQEWVDYCVRVSFEAYERSLGRRCQAFRFGDHWINEATLELIENLGAIVDLTSEPGERRPRLSPKAVGLIPDFSRTPREPFKPSREDMASPNGAGRNLWLIPLSTADIEWSVNSLIIKCCPDLGDPAAPISRASTRFSNQPAWDGFLDRADYMMISGWVYDASRPNDCFNVEIFDSQDLIATVPANSFRPDLLAAGKGNGRHAFSLPTPDLIKDGKPHSIWAKVEGCEFALRLGDVEERVEPVLLLNTEPWLMAQGINSLLASMARPHLALPVRSNVSLLESEFRRMQANFDFLLEHPLRKRFVFEAPSNLVASLSTQQPGH